MRHATRIRVCASCGVKRRLQAHDWCDPCYRRWRAAGRPASGPPEPYTRGTGYNIPGSRESRIEEWTFLRGYHYSPAKIAARMGVSMRTIYRYAAAERAAGLSVEQAMQSLFGEAA